MSIAKDASQQASNESSLAHPKTNSGATKSPVIEAVPPIDRLGRAVFNHISKRNFDLPPILTGWDLALALNGFDPKQQLSKSDPSMTEQVLAVNVAEEAIRRAVLAGKLACSSPGNSDPTYYRFRLFRLIEAEAWAGKSKRFPKFIGNIEPELTGWAWHFEEDLWNESECAMLLDKSKSKSVHKENSVLLSQSIDIGDLPAIVNPNASGADRMYRSARFIKPGDLLSWADRTGRYPEIVSIAKSHGFIVSAATRSSTRQTKLSAWLRNEMSERGITAYRLHKAGGPEGKTTKLILNGHLPSENVRERLAAGLTHEGRTVTLQDIPID